MSSATDSSYLHMKDRAEAAEARVAELEAALKQALLMLDATVINDACPPSWAEKVDALHIDLKGKGQD